MNIRGNHILTYSIQLASGILTYILCENFGDIGLLAITIYIVGLILTIKPDADEMEMQLLFKIGHVESTIVATVMGMIYFVFPEFNWFYVLISSYMVFGGITGLFYFSRA